LAETKSAERLSPLQRQQRQLTVDSLIRAAHRGMSEYGLDVTVDDIAALAQVGRRTVFRHFATREELLQEALSAFASDFMDSFPKYSGGDWRQWLAELTRVVHHTVAAAGRMILEARIRRLPPGLQRVYDRDLELLRQIYAESLDTMWKAAGGAGAAPQLLVDSFTAHMSPLFTQAVVRDAKGTPERAAELATAAIAATVSQLRGEARRTVQRKTGNGATSRPAVNPKKTAAARKLR
jgi:AcrR family transcriptional regulator